MFYFWRKLNMNKTHVFPVIALILVFVFACTIPSSVEVKGSPSLKFAANVDFNDVFSDMLDDVFNSGDDEVQIVNCTNPSLDYTTYLIHMEVYRDDDYRCEADEDSFEDNEGKIIINNTEIPVEYVEEDDGDKFLVLENDEIIASSSDNPYILSFKSLEGYIEGFEFTGIKARVYVSGSQLASVVSIDLYKSDSDGNEILILPDDEITSRNPSGLELLEEYTGQELPPGGGEIDISDEVNSCGELSIIYKIYLSKDSVIDYDWLGISHSIVVELVIWIPMTLESIEDNAVFKFPDFFDGIGDVFKSLAGTGLVENMSIKIDIHPLNPFGNGIFVISDDNYGYIQRPLDDYSFLIELNEEEIEYINKNPFDPVFFVLFPNKKSLLGVPNGDLMISTVSLNTELKYNGELKK
jgi:hypothetical protein